MLLVLTATLVTGCATGGSYAAPGPAADMARFGAATAEEQARLSDFDIQQIRQRQPLARFPVSLAVARVQGANYQSYSARGYGEGEYSVVTTRDVEPEDAAEQLNALPMVRGVAPVGRLLLPRELRDDRDLRAAAAAAHADMLLVYTIDTQLTTDSSGSPLDVVTLGFLPHQEVRVNATASSVLLDVGNGFVYGIAEGSAMHTQRANTWTDEKAADQAVRKAETEAVADMLEQFKNTWSGVVANFAQPLTPGANINTGATTSVAMPPAGQFSPPAQYSPPIQNATPVRSNPQVSNSVFSNPAPNSAQVTLSLSPDGTYRLGPEPLTREQLRIRAAELARQSPRPTVTLSVPADAPGAAVGEAMTLLGEAGLTVRVSTQP